MTIYLLQSPDGEHLLYTQIGAFLECQLNPIFVTPQHWSSLAKDGYPVHYKGWTVEKHTARSGKTVREENSNFL